MGEMVDFYFDYLSPYAYLASLELPALCERHEVELRLRPVLFAGLLNHWGQLGPAEIPPKATHAFKDCLRYALLRGIPLRSPRHVPFNSLTALRVSLPEVSGRNQVRVVETLFQHGWEEGGDLGEPMEIAAALEKAGVEGRALVARTREPEVKLALRSDTDAAISRGVFGIPTLIANGELFWGLDQLGNLERFLEGKDPLASISLDELRTQGPSAWRPGVPRREEG